MSYPYGASVLDARRKLEYDLYYMKHMSVFLDVFILLDTVRIILTGGVQGQDVRKTASPENMRAWTTAKAEDDAPVALPPPAPGLKLETV